MSMQQTKQIPTKPIQLAFGKWQGVHANDDGRVLNHVGGGIPHAKQRAAHSRNGKHEVGGNVVQRREKAVDQCCLANRPARHASES